MSGVLDMGVVHVLDAVFPILADVVEVKNGSGSTAHWSIHFLRLTGWLRHSFTLLITPLDIDQAGQNWEDSNRASQTAKPVRARVFARTCLQLNRL